MEKGRERLKMKILRNAVAGTMESSDAVVTIFPSDAGLQINLTSTVEAQYGASIYKLVKDVLERMDIDSAIVSINDHGALDCTLRARVETAVIRAQKEKDEDEKNYDIPSWE